MLHYFPPVVAGVLVPTLVVMALIVIPYFNINVEAEGVFLKDRKRRLLIFYVVAAALCLFLLWFDVLVALVPTLIVVGFMVLAAAKFSAVAFGFPALSGLQTTFLLDHDLVSFRTHSAHRSWHFLPRPRLVLGVALEELTCSRHHRSRHHHEEHADLAVADIVRPSRARFGTVSLLLLISLAIAPAKNHFSEWRHYQKQYLALVAEPRRSGNPAAPLPRTEASSRSGFRSSES